ncbi:MAG: hypothetical protein RL653_1752, partial [Pseudomonadota bacterium]
MRFLRSFRWRRFVVLGGLLLLAATPLALRTRFAWDQACRAARARLPELLDADVEIGACELEPLSGGARLKEIRVRPRNAGPGAPPLLEADEASVSVTAVRPGLRTVELGQVRLLRPRLVLDLSRPRPPRDGAPGCGLEPLKRVEVETLEVRDAS